MIFQNCDEEYEEPDPEIQASVPPPGRRPPRMPAPDPPSEVKKIVINTIIEPVGEKTNNLGSHQVRHKPGCTVTEDG